EFARQAFLDDLQMQQPKETAAEAKAERRARFHFISKTRIIEAQLAHSCAQIFELRGIDREEPAKHDGDGRTKTRHSPIHRMAIVGDGVADAGIGYFLD